MDSEKTKQNRGPLIHGVTIKTRLAFTFFTFFVLVSVCGFLWLRQIEILGDATRSVRDVALPKIISANEAERALTTHRLQVRRSAQTNDFRQLATIERTLRVAEGVFETNLAKLSLELKTAPEVLLADRALKRWESYLVAVDDVRKLTEQGELRQARARLDQGAELAASQLFDTLHELVDLTRNESDFISAQMEQQYQDARNLTITIVLAALFVTLLATWWTAKAISGPLLKITTALRRLSDGQDDAEIPPLSDRQNEIGALARAANAYRDNLIETRKLASDLSHERTRLYETVKNIPFALGVFDQNGEVIVSNDAFHNIFDLPKEFEITNPSQQDVLSEIGKKFTSNGSTNFSEHILKTVGEKASKTEIWKTVEDRIISVTVKSRPEGWMLIGEDITEQERIRAVSEQAERQRTIGLLTGGVAHDFNNLLAVIMGNQELLRDGLTDHEDLKMVDASISAAARGADLTQSMLSFAQKARLSPRDLDLGALVNEMRDLFERTLPSSIDVVVNTDDNLWPVHADPRATENALLNLIVNARDAMPDGGRLSISLTNQVVEESDISKIQNGLSVGNYVELTVMDSGQGIAPEHLEKIFEPFFSTKGPGAGSGLGLSRVYGFMKQSSGRIVVSSTVNKGTMFCLWFPAKKLQNAKPSKGRDDQSVPTLVGQRVLVAEDDDDVRKIIVTMLETAQCIVMSAPDGNTALKVFQENPGFDLVLTDVMMPGGMLGTELVEKIKEIQPDMPAILLTGYADSDISNPTDKSTTMLLRKPVNRKDLISKVAQAIATASTP